MKEVIEWRDVYMSRSVAFLETIDQLRKDVEDAYEVADTAEKRFDELRALHSAHTRVMTWTLDPLRLTAQLRAIEPSLRVERDGDKMIVYADVTLTEPQVNAVSAMLLAQPNRT